MQLHAASALVGHAGVPPAGAFPFTPGSFARPAPAWSRCSILLAPGLDEVLAQDWQRQLPRFHTVWHLDRRTPDLDVWAQAIVSAAQHPSGPVVVVAQGFACLAAVRAAALHPGLIAGALLTAPADPTRFGLQETLSESAPDLSSVLLVNEGDRDLPPERAWQWALHWNSQFVSLGQGGRGAERTDRSAGQGKPDLRLDLLEQLCRRVAGPA